MDLAPILPYLSEWLGVIAVTWLIHNRPAFFRRNVTFRNPTLQGRLSLSLFLISLVIVGFICTRSTAVPGTADFYHVILAAIAFIPFAIAWYLQKQTWASLGWNKVFFRQNLLLGFVLLLLTVFLSGKVYSLLKGVSMTGANALFALVFISAIEETLFRCFIRLRLTAWLGENIAWLVTAGLFVLWNILLSTISGVSFGLSIVQVIIIIGQALILGWVARYTNHIVAVILYRLASDWVRFL